MYNKNKSYQKFSNWWYENSLLGYSYSHDLKECFEEQYGVLNTLKEVKELPEQTCYKVVCQVKDFFTKISQNGNKYMIIEASDNTASSKFILMDNSREEKLSDFLNNYKISKDAVLVLNASKSRDTSFINSARVVDTKIMMKLKDLKTK
jgi:DNA polymerase III alpha subunit